MKLKILLKILLVFIGVLALITSIIIMYFFNYYSPVSIIPIYSHQFVDSSVGVVLIRSELPARLKIPKINVDSFIEYVGLTPIGAMDVPKGPDNVGWFDLGPRPGEVGSAVIAGHYGWKDNIPAVFDDLSKLEKGDKIYIEDSTGTTTTFVVREIGIYKSDTDAANVFGSNDGLAHLNLITCEGVWNPTKKGRPNRLIIFTDKEI